MVSTLAQYLHLQVGSLSVARDLVDCHVVWGCSSPVLSPKPHQWLKVSPVGEPGRLHRPGSHLGHLLKIYVVEVIVVEPLTTKVKELVSRHLRSNIPLVGANALSQTTSGASGVSCQGAGVTPLSSDSSSGTRKRSQHQGQ